MARRRAPATTPGGRTRRQARPGGEGHRPDRRGRRCLTLLPAQGAPQKAELPAAGETQTAVEAVRTGQEPALLGGQLARDALVLCHRECESGRTGRAIDV